MLSTKAYNKLQIKTKSTILEILKTLQTLN